jgi:hypothetical protein
LNKKILKGRAETIKRHCMKAGFHTKPTDVGDPSPSTQLCINMMLVAQDMILSFHPLEFDDNIFS